PADDLFEAVFRLMRSRRKGGPLPVQDRYQAGTAYLRLKDLADLAEGDAEQPPAPHEHTAEAAGAADSGRTIPGSERAREVTSRAGRPLGLVHWAHARKGYPSASVLWQQAVKEYRGLWFALPERMPWDLVPQ